MIASAKTPAMMLTNIVKNSHAAIPARADVVVWRKSIEKRMDSPNQKAMYTMLSRMNTVIRAISAPVGKIPRISSPMPVTSSIRLISIIKIMDIPARNLPFITESR
jgi:hypothetical protein